MSKSFTQLWEACVSTCHAVRDTPEGCASVYPGTPSLNLSLDASTDVYVSRLKESVTRNWAVAGTDLAASVETANSNDAVPFLATRARRGVRPDTVAMRIAAPESSPKVSLPVVLGKGYYWLTLAVAHALTLQGLHEGPTIVLYRPNRRIALPKVGTLDSEFYEPPTSQEGQRARRLCTRSYGRLLKRWSDGDFSRGWEEFLDSNHIGLPGDSTKLSAGQLTATFTVLRQCPESVLRAKHILVSLPTVVVSTRHKEEISSSLSSFKSGEFLLPEMAGVAAGYPARYKVTPAGAPADPRSIEGMKAWIRALLISGDPERDPMGLRDSPLVNSGPFSGVTLVR